LLYKNMDMKKYALTISLLVFTLSFQSFAQYHHGNLKIKRAIAYANTEERSPEQFDLSFSYENLRLFPIIAGDAFIEQHKDLGKFTLLKDAIEQNKIIITETGARNLANAEVVPIETVVDTTTQEFNGDQVILQQPISNQHIQELNVNQINISGSVGGNVNTLFAQNKSSDTIFIMAGEVVKGGKQDRVIGQDVVLAPGEGVDLSAFCVEKSRWTTKNNNRGEFTGYYTVSSMDIRKSVTEDKNQAEVWRKVDEHTSKNGATSDTKAYTNLANSEEYQNTVKAYLNTFEDAFKDNSRVIGVIAVTGNEIMGCDLFATHDLFIDSYVGLIHSYMSHAITQGSEVTINNDAVYAYLDSFLKSEEGQNEEIEKNGTVFEWKKRKLHITKY